MGIYVRYRWSGMGCGYLLKVPMVRYGTCGYLRKVLMVRYGTRGYLRKVLMVRYGTCGYLRKVLMVRINGSASRLVQLLQKGEFKAI